MAKSFFDVPTFAIVTGASRGIGRAIAIEFSKRFTNRLHIVITARNDEALQETASMIRGETTFSSSKTTIRLVIGDLGDRASFTNLAGNLFKDVDQSKYEHAILVNNAGTIGDVTKYVRDWNATAIKSIEDYFYLNVVSTLFLINKFLSLFSNHKSETVNTDPMRRTTIVHLTSLSAVVPTECMSLYCAGKAAREMLHNVAAIEEPSVRVLNYAPGPVDTSMLKDLKENTASSKTTEMITNAMKIAVSPQKTASVLCDYLKEEQYESGSRVDLYDIIGFPKTE